MAWKQIDNPLVSVIIPTYNRKTLVLEAVESVLQGTFQDFELIVVDDGSSDGTVEVLVHRGFTVRGSVDLSSIRTTAALPSDMFSPSTPHKDGLAPPLDHGSVSSSGSAAYRDSPDPFYAEPAPSVDSSFPAPPLILLSLTHTGFPGLVRNRGARIARGTYLAFLDSDDLWLPQKLELQLKAHREAITRGQRYRISHTRELWDRKGKIVSQRKQKHRREGDVFQDALKKCILGPSTVMMEKSLFLEAGGFREDIQIAEDYELWVRITSFEPVLYLEEPLTIKRGGFPDQLSQTHPFIEPFRLKALKDLVDQGFFLHRADRQKEATEELVRKCQIHAEGCRKRGKLEEAAYWEAQAEQYRT